MAYERELALVKGIDTRLRGTEFSDSALDVVRIAEREAIRFNHNYIGTEHLLLGLSQVPPIDEILDSLGARPNKIRNAVEFIIGRGDEKPKKVGFTPRARKVVELSLDEARRLEYPGVKFADIPQGLPVMGPDHLLLGVVREGEGIAAGVLENLGVNLHKVRQAVLKVRRQDNLDGQTLSQTPLEVASYLSQADIISTLLRDPNISEQDKQKAGLILDALTHFLSPQDRTSNQPKNLSQE